MFKSRSVLLMTFLAMVANGCVTERRCNEKFPAFEHRETVYRDTVIVTSATHFDTLLQFTGRDTIFIRDAKTQIQVKVVRVRDSVYIHSECPPDTIRVEKVWVETTVERVRHILSDHPYRILWIILAGIGFIFSFGYLINSIKK